MGKIKLIVGLGNPGEKYENTRHNIGFLFVDYLAKRLKISGFEFNKKFNAEMAETRFPIPGFPFQKVLLAKPRTFMNKSGSAVLIMAKYFKIKPENILIVHDDIDIEWQKYKFSFGRSSAGHKGVDSIIKNLKTKDFWRLRIGIQPTAKKHIKADKIILKKFASGELKKLGQDIKKVVSELETAWL